MGENEILCTEHQQTSTAQTITIFKNNEKGGTGQENNFPHICILIVKYNLNI